MKYIANQPQFYRIDDNLAHLIFEGIDTEEINKALSYITHKNQSGRIAGIKKYPNSPHGPYTKIKFSETNPGLIDFIAKRFEE